ncbi:MAG: vWA domain-containing protein [Microcoleaceae cyanobacterium]
MVITAQEVTNWYLYDQSTTPENLVDDSLIRPALLELDPAQTTIELDAKDFMETAGRFAIGPQFELVQRFFYEDNEPLFELAEDGTVIPVLTQEWEEFTVPGTYSKRQLAAPDKFNLPSFGWNMQHYNWQDETDDYTERVYIYNSQEYKISDDAVFVVAPNGDKWIENFRVEPREIAEEDRPGITARDRDDFDFTSSDWAATIGGLILEDNIDPSEIGRTVYFDYVNQNTIIPVTYTRSDYDNDIEKWNSFTKGLKPVKLLDETFDLMDQLFADGVTDFRDDENQPIFYGTEEADGLTALSYPAPKLEPFLDNGAVLIGGDGNDELTGGISTNTNTTYIGGQGNDTIIGSRLTDGSEDISVYEGSKADYNIEFSGNFLTGRSVKITDTVADRDGSDTLKSVEFAQFSDQKVNIGPGQDISFVIDRTTSMRDDIDAVIASANQILDAIFDSDRGLLDSRISVVGYNNSGATTYLSFTDQPKIEDRKTAAINALNSISLSGGIEPVNGALIHSLSGNAGNWREEASARRIFLFGDEPADDPQLLSQVLNLASDVGVPVLAVVLLYRQLQGMLRPVALIRTWL